MSTPQESDIKAEHFLAALDLLIDKYGGVPAGWPTDEEWAALPPEMTQTINKVAVSAALAVLKQAKTLAVTLALK